MERVIQQNRMLGERQRKPNSDMNGSLLHLKRRSMCTSVCAYVNQSASNKKSNWKPHQLYQCLWNSFICLLKPNSCLFTTFPFLCLALLHYDHSCVCDSDLKTHTFEYPKLNPKGCLHKFMMKTWSLLYVIIPNSLSYNEYVHFQCSQ